jgi:hypothetical protein
MTCAADTDAERYARELPELGAWLWRESGGRRVRDIGEGTTRSASWRRRRASNTTIWPPTPSTRRMVRNAIAGYLLAETPAP